MNAEDVAILIRARQIAKEKGIPVNADVKTICEHAEVSRKTGYQWVDKYGKCENGQVEELTAELQKVKAECQTFEKRCGDLRFAYKGLELACEIHGLDQLLKSKKSTAKNKKRKKP